MLNIVTIQGRLCDTPQVRYTQAQKPVVSTAIAVERDFKNGDEKTTDFVNCVFFGQQAEFLSKYFSKGSMAICSGRLQSRHWEDKDGKKHIEWEVIVDRVWFGESKKKEEQSPFPPGVTGRVDKSKLQEMDDETEDLPF